MKRYIILIQLLILGLTSCEKVPYEEFVNESTANQITRIQLFGNSREIVANGTNELTFKIRAFGEVQVETKIEDENGNPKDTIITQEFRFKEGRLPENAISIYTENGELVNGNTFSTTAVSDSLGFYAEGGNFTSDMFKVKLVAPAPTNFAPITIPVVFHMVSSDENKDIINSYNSEFFQEQIAKLNKVFSGELFKGPTNIDLNVKFELATHDPSGKVLDELGLTRTSLGDSAYDENIEYVQNNLMWDPTKYLNIWITQWDRWGDPYDADAPKYFIGDSSILQGLNLNEVTDASQASISKPQDIGIFISPNEINTEEFNFPMKIGEFFGLLFTQYRNNDVNGDVDYCSDTFTYRLYFYVVEKNTQPLPNPDSPRYTYDSFNIMDRYSAAKAISYQQGLRIRAVLENCPLRMMRK